MRFGLALPHYDFSLPNGEPATFEALAAFALRAEQLGFDSLWISDHFFLSLARYGGEDREFGSLEAMTALAGLATVTERVRLGTLVLGAPFRHPAMLARQAAVIQQLSGGRLELGLGAGWYQREFEAFGYGFEALGERFRLLEETVEALASEDGGPPIWLGGKGGPRLLRLVARHAAGWNTVWAWTPQAYAERAVAARRACEEIGRDPASLRLSVGLYTIVGADEAALRARFERMRAWPHGAGMLAGKSVEEYAADTLTGTPEQVIERVREFAALGVQELILSPAPVPFAVPDPEMLVVIAERVLPAAREL